MVLSLFTANFIPTVTVLMQTYLAFLYITDTVERLEFKPPAKAYAARNEEIYAINVMLKEIKSRSLQL